MVDGGMIARLKIAGGLEGEGEDFFGPFDRGSGRKGQQRRGARRVDPPAVLVSFSRLAKESKGKGRGEGGRWVSGCWTGRGCRGEGATKEGMRWIVWVVGMGRKGCGAKRWWWGGGNVEEMKGSWKQARRDVEKR